MADHIPILNRTRLIALTQGVAAGRPDWVEDAACTELALAGDAYFPDGETTPSAADLARCAGCPVSHQCLAAGLFYDAHDGERIGWWGGLGPIERQRLWETLGAPEALPSVEPAVQDPVIAARRLRDRSLTVPAIAAQLGVSERTVFRYLAATAA